MLPKMMRSAAQTRLEYRGDGTDTFQAESAVQTQRVDSDEALVELRLPAKSVRAWEQKHSRQVFSSALSNTAQPEFPRILLAQTILQNADYHFLPWSTLHAQTINFTVIYTLRTDDIWDYILLRYSKEKRLLIENTTSYHPNSIQFETVEMDLRGSTSRRRRR